MSFIRLRMVFKGKVTNGLKVQGSEGEDFNISFFEGGGRDTIQSIRSAYYNEGISKWSIKQNSSVLSIEGIMEIKKSSRNSKTSGHVPIHGILNSHRISLLTIHIN